MISCEASKHFLIDFLSVKYATIFVNCFTDSLSGETSKHSLIDFLSVKMSGQILLAVELPQLADGDVFKSFKITPRWQV